MFSPQEAVERSPFTLLQTRQAQISHMLLTGYMFQLCCPPLDTFKNLHIFLKLQGPELHSTQGEGMPALVPVAFF